MGTQLCSKPVLATTLHATMFTMLLHCSTACDDTASDVIIYSAEAVMVASVTVAPRCFVASTTELQRFHRIALKSCS
jgi:hypothetical protein